MWRNYEKGREENFDQNIKTNKSYKKQKVKYQEEHENDWMGM